MKIGERHHVKILKMISKGKGLARLEDKVVFIPYVLPEEEVEIEITSIKKDYLLANKISVLTPSRFRIDPPCPVFGQCGGCQLQMVDYPHQLQFKVDFLKETLHRIGKMPLSKGLASPPPPAEPDGAFPSRSLCSLDPVLLPLIPVSDPFHYRQRAKFQASFENEKVVIGFYRLESKEIVPIENCFIISPPLNGLLKEVSLFLNKNPLSFKTLKEVSFSISSTSQDVLIEFNGKDLPDRESFFQGLFSLPYQITGIFLSGEKNQTKILGKKYLFNLMKDPLHPEDLVKIRNSAGGFSQVNREMNLKLIETLLSWAKLSGKESVLELYCGNGNFTLLMAKQASHLTAVEENPVAVEDLRFNLQSNQIKNCSVRKGNVRAVLSRWDKTKFPIDLLILDPPREGMDQSSLQSVLRIRPARILYISCDPATLARDLKALLARYTIQRIAPFDMFPQTAHIETLTELQLK